MCVTGARILQFERLELVNVCLGVLSARTHLHPRQSNCDSIGFVILPVLISMRACASGPAQSRCSIIHVDETELNLHNRPRHCRESHRRRCIHSALVLVAWCSGLLVHLNYVDGGWVDRPAGWEADSQLPLLSKEDDRVNAQHPSTREKESNVIAHPSLVPESLRALPPPLGGGSEQCAAQAHRSMDKCGPNAVLKGGNDILEHASEAVRDAAAEQWCWCDPGFRIRDRPFKQCIPKSLDLLVLASVDQTPASSLSVMFHVSSRGGCECAVDEYADIATLAYAHSRAQLADPAPHAMINASAWSHDLVRPWVESASKPTITLLVSHFPQQSLHPHPHHAEIEAAMRANLLNPALTELYVAQHNHLKSIQCTRRLEKGPFLNVKPKSYSISQQQHTTTLFQVLSSIV